MEIDFKSIRHATHLGTINIGAFYNTVNLAWDDLMNAIRAQIGGVAAICNGAEGDISAARRIYELRRYRHQDHQ